MVIQVICSVLQQLLFVLALGIWQFQSPVKTFLPLGRMEISIPSENLFCPWVGWKYLSLVKTILPLGRMEISISSEYLTIFMQEKLLLCQENCVVRASANR